MRNLPERREPSTAAHDRFKRGKWTSVAALMEERVDQEEDAMLESLRRGAEDGDDGQLAELEGRTSAPTEAQLREGLSAAARILIEPEAGPED